MLLLFFKVESRCNPSEISEKTCESCRTFSLHPLASGLKVTHYDWSRRYLAAKKRHWCRQSKHVHFFFRLDWWSLYRSMSRRAELHSGKGPIVSGKGRWGRQRAAVQYRTWPGNGCRCGDSRSKQTSVNTPRGPFVKAVHYPLHHDIKPPSFSKQSHLYHLKDIKCYSVWFF